MNSPIISPQVLHQLLQSGQPVVVFDCRFDLKNPEAGFKAYQKDHISTSHYAHLEKDLSGPAAPGKGRHPMPSPKDFEDFLNKRGVDEKTLVIAYDDQLCTFAARMWWLLKYFGHKHAAVLDGGFKKWREAGYSIDSETPGFTPGHFKAVPQEPMLKKAGQLLQNIKYNEFVLMDVRTSERFSGESETFDKKAGHIPGAKNHPFILNMTEDGLFKSPAELRKIFSGLEEVNEVCLMCGSGVTACNNIIAMELAGLPQPSLYAGSWSEWIQDDSRPVAEGMD